MLWKAPWDHQKIYRSLQLSFSWLLCCVVYNYSQLSWQKPFELILIIKSHCIHCFSSAIFYFRGDVPFPRRDYTQESQNWPTVVSGSDLWRSILQTPAQSRSNLKGKSVSSRNRGAEFGKPAATAIPLIPLLGALFLCVNAVVGRKKRNP